MDKKSQLIRWLPLSLIVIAFVAFFYFHLYEYLSFQVFKQYHHQLLEYSNQHFPASLLIYIGIYIVAVAISVPGAVFLTLVGGFLFGIGVGTLSVVIAATLGATLLFLSVRTSLGYWLAQRASPYIKKMESGFKRDAFYYLLALRLIPLFPFWLVNVVAALLGIELKQFIVATLIGIIPGSLVYVMLGNGLGYLFAQNETPNLAIIFKAPILLPLLGLAILSLLPILYKRLRKINGNTQR